MVPSRGYVSVTRRPPDVEDYIEMFRRYRPWVFGPAFAGLVISVITAFFWPDTFVSSAVMRITPQQVPERLIQSNITSQIAERLSAMQTDILSRSSLLELIQRPALDLYPRERQRKPMEDIVEQMRNSIRITIRDAPTAQARNRAASAFEISFAYSDRYKAQAVVRELVAKFTEQNVTVLRNQASLTTTFLNNEVRAAKQKLDQLDVEIARFKTENQGRLPEHLQTNLQTVNALQVQLAAVTDMINRNGQEKLMLEVQLQNLRNQAAFINTNMEEAVTAQTVKNERLIQLNKVILDSETALAAAREMYKDDHPDVRTLRKRLEVIKRERDALTTEEQHQQATAEAPAKRVNPQASRLLEDIKSNIAIVQAQINAKELDMERRLKQQAEVNKAIENYQGRIQVSPANEQKYEAMLRDYGIAKAKYEEMSHKKELSETAQNLEERNVGENLEVLDPASLPEQPSKPNRMLISAAGTMIGLLAGVMLGVIKEVKNTSLKNLKDVRAYTNLPVLSSIPLLENARVVRRKRRLFWVAWSAAIMIGTIAMSGSMYYYYYLKRR